MAITRQQLLGRAAREVPRGGCFWAVGLDPTELSAARASAAALRSWPDRALDAASAETPDVVLLAARSVNAEGHMTLTAAAEESLAQPAVRQLLRRCPRLVAVVLPQEGEPAPRWDELTTSPTERPLLDCRAHRILSEHAVLDVAREGLVIRELARGLSARTLQAHTPVALRISPDVVEMALAVAEKDDHGVA